MKKVETSKEIKAEFANLNKNNTLAEYVAEVAKGAYETERCLVVAEYHMTSAEFDEFSNSLLHDIDWVAELRGGTDSDYVSIYNLETKRGYFALLNDAEELAKWRAEAYRLVGEVINDETGAHFFVDPQGYKYARYVGLPVDGVGGSTPDPEPEVEEPEVEVAEAAPVVAPVPSGKGHLVSEIRDRVRVHRGIEYGGKVEDGAMAEIVKGKSIRIFGIRYKGTDHEVPYDLTFNLGDRAEHGSYNLVYTGRIVGIGLKTVTITKWDNEPDGRKRVLSLYEFTWRNWDWDEEKVDRRNADTMMYI